MSPCLARINFCRDEDGGVLVFWAVGIAAFLGLAGLIFDVGRVAATQGELQSYIDSAALSAAAELDGRADALARATAAARGLTDRQTFGTTDRALGGTDTISLTFYRPGIGGKFRRDASLVTTDPKKARFVEATSADIALARSFSGTVTEDASVAARAVASFQLEACNAAPVAVCLPSADFSAAASIGKTLMLDTGVAAGITLPGNLIGVKTLTPLLDGLSVCAGLSGGTLDACLMAARQPQTACAGGDGLTISVDAAASAQPLIDGLNTRFGIFRGLTSGLAGNPEFSPAPNVLTGLTNALGLCQAQNLLPTAANVGLPRDDCHAGGGCSVQGDGTWSVGRAAYVEAHYGGRDPFPQARTRFEFYQAEVAASGQVRPDGLIGGLVGGLLGGLTPAYCSPAGNLDPTRRLMVVAGIDCGAVTLGAEATTPPVQEFFEVFTLGPAEGGKIAVEVTACLDVLGLLGGCGKGNLGTDVRRVTRLVE